MKYLLLFLLFLSFLWDNAAGQGRVDEVHADSLYENFKNKKALKAYNRILKSDADNLSALWHSSLLYARIGSDFKAKKRKKKYLKRSIQRARLAYKMDPNDTNTNFAMAVSIGEMARVGDIKQKLAAASEVKKYAERSVRADSSNAGAWFTLGAWNYRISTMNSFKEMAANIFGNVPNGASTENAVRYMRKAVDLKPSFILYYVGLARSYKAMGRNEMVKKVCRMALEKPLQTSHDSEHKGECRKLMANLN